MSYSKPEQMSDQEFYISVEQVRSAINENYTCKRQTSKQLQIKVWAKKYTQKKLANIFVQRRVRPRPCHAESNQFLLPPSPGSMSTAICFNRYFRHHSFLVSLCILVIILLIFIFVIFANSIAMMDFQVSYSPRVHSVAHMLLVTEAQGGDAGQYRCTARNEVRPWSSTPSW